MIDPGGAYYPFIRLALARYQPISVEGAHLSKVVQADFAQLVPDRTAIVQRESPTSLKVHARGPAYKGSWLGQQTSEMEVTVEQKQAGPVDELVWVPINSSTTVMQPSMYTALQTAWNAKITLPDAEKGKYRLIIKEYERYVVDKPFDQAAEPPKPVGAVSSQPKPTERRLVYSDVFVL